VFHFFYNLFISLYGLVVRVFAIKNEKAKRFLRGRKDVFSRINEAELDHFRHLVWFHVASLGEFEQARPIIETLKSSANAEYGIVLTFFSPSGYDQRKNYELADLTTYLPLDTPSKARRFFDCLNLIWPFL